MSEFERRIEIVEARNRLKDIQEAMGQLTMQRLYWEEKLEQLTEVSNE